MKIAEKVQCKKSFQQGIAYASALVMEMCINCDNHSHQRTLKIVSDKIIEKAMIAYARGDVCFEEETQNDN